MRRGGLVCVGILLVASGCLLQRGARQLNVLERFRPPMPPAGVVMDVALLEQPFADPYIDHEIWADVDEQIVSFEKRAILETNGLRVGQVGGVLPSKLQELLLCDRTNLHPFRAQLYDPNTPTIVPLNGPLPKARFRYPAEDSLDPEVREFTNAQLGLEVFAEALTDERIRLKFVPLLQHGERRHWLQNPLEGTTLSGHGRRPQKRCVDASWEVTLAVQEYLVVGTQSDQEETFGYEGLTTANRPDGRRTQRLLVIRAAEVGVSPHGENGTTKNLSRSGTMPVASQANFSVSRGKQP